MIDFLKTNPYVTKDQYMWEWTIPQIKLASFDFSHVVYLSEKDNTNKDATVINSGEDLINDLGIPVHLFKNKD